MNELRTYRLELIGTVMDEGVAKAVNKVVNTPPIIIDKTLIVAVEPDFFDMKREDREAKCKEITEMIVRPGGLYENVMFIPKGYQFMRAIEI